MNVEILEVGLERELSFLDRKNEITKKGFADRPIQKNFPRGHETEVLYFGLTGIFGLTLGFSHPLVSKHLVVHSR